MIGVHLYTRGTGGVPATTVLADELRGRITSYSHSIAAVGGFESASVKLQVRLDEIPVIMTWLMRPVVMTGPDAETIWEGFLSGVSATIGQESIDLSLEDMANAVAVRYQPDIGAQISTAFTTDVESIATYGRKELSYSASGMTTGAATALRDALLNAQKNPVARRTSQVATGDTSKDCAVTITFTGWYYTLDWLMRASTSTSTTSTTTQVISLLTTYNSTNTFFSTSTDFITASGVSDTELMDEGTTYRTKIERLLNLGNSSSQRQAWGVYEDRAFHIGTWAGATPTTVTYQRSLGEGVIRDAAGNIVMPWNVRPDSMYQVRELLDTDPLSTTQDAAARYYVERVACSVEGNTMEVRLEPTKSTGADVLIARMR